MIAIAKPHRVVAERPRIKPRGGVGYRPKPAGQREVPIRRVKATYDAARDSVDTQNHWANADQYDADSANSRAVRAKLVSRSRYEIANNGFADGIAQTYATDLVGIGPKLRMQTNSTAFNQMVEREWYRWAKAVQLRRKLWCMAHAKYQDGEAFGLLVTNPNLRNDVKLDIQLIETEQCQTPYMAIGDVGQIDGIVFDRFGNPVAYDILPSHPGNSSSWVLTQEPIRYPAEGVLHWFLMRRPGQHRGIPEATSTLNVGANARRFREATVAAAETAADHAGVMETQSAPGDEILDQSVLAMDQFPIDKRVMTALPAGWKLSQMKAEHPGTTYEAFNRSLVNEMARPVSMPYNKAACDSSSYNYASGRLDHQTYYGAIDVQREDGNDLVLDRLFEAWFAEAVMAFGWLGGAKPTRFPSHAWDWPKHPVADLKSEAQATDSKLRNGSLTLSRVYAEAGEDFADDVEVMADDYGLSVPDMKALLRTAIFQNGNPQQAQNAADQAAQDALQEAAANGQ